MKILKKDYKKGFLKTEIETLDDLWYLSYIIDNEDVISAKTERKIKIGDDDQRSIKIVRKKLWLKIICEKIQFAESGNELRISGKIFEGVGDISAGDYHTLNISESDVVEISKGKRGFLKYQMQKIEEASKNKVTNIMLCVVDRGEAIFAILKKYGYEIINREKGDVEKKDFNENIKSSFFDSIAKIIFEYSQKYSINTIVIGTIPFWKESVKKELDSKDMKANVIYTTCSSSKENALKEIMENQEVKSALKDERFAVETTLVSEILSRISRDGNVAYGIKEVDDCANAGAIEKLLVTDGIIQKKREEEKYEEIDEIMQKVDGNKGEIFIISSSHESGEQLDGLGGIAGTLRFKIK